MSYMYFFLNLTSQFNARELIFFSLCCFLSLVPAEVSLNLIAVSKHRPLAILANKWPNLFNQEWLQLFDVPVDSQELEIFEDSGNVDQHTIKSPPRVRRPLCTPSASMDASKLTFSGSDETPPIDVDSIQKAVQQAAEIASRFAARPDTSEQPQNEDPLQLDDQDCDEPVETCAASATTPLNISTCETTLASNAGQNNNKRKATENGSKSRGAMAVHMSSAKKQNTANGDKS